MLKTLIVDNEAVIRRGLAACMDWEAQGYTIAGQAADGIEALELMERLQPDIVISDIRMPGMDGLALTAEIRRRWPHVQVIILTGYPDFSYAQKAITYGVVDFVLKPTSPDDLAAALESARKRILQRDRQLEINRRLDRSEQRNLQLRQSLFLNELIHTQAPDEAYIREQRRKLGLRLDAYQVLRVHMEAAQDTPEGARDAQEEARALLQRSLNGLPHTHIQRAGLYSYYVVETGGAPRLPALCRRAAETADNLLLGRLTIGISEPHAGGAALHEAARQARQAQQFAAYSPGSFAVSYSEIPAASYEDMKTITAQLQLLRGHIENQQQEQAEARLAEIFAAVRAARLPMQEVHKIGSFVVHFCVDSLFTAHAPQSISALPSTQPMLESETPDGMEQGLQAYIRRMLALNASDPGNVAEAVAAVKEHVALHYAEPLTLDALAKIVYLSPGYLSKLFKRETGENLNTYIQNLRIQKAKELLRATQLKNYEVAEQVGIPDPVYFARLFKRITGKKPKDFRSGRESGG